MLYLMNQRHCLIMLCSVKVRRKIIMRVSYAKLWKLLIDNKMKKGELFSGAKITDTARRQLNHDEPVHLKVLMNICKVFHCNLSDVVDIVEE